MNDLAWQIPIFGLAAAMLFRLLVTPYELWRTERTKADDAELALVATEGPVRDYRALTKALLYSRFGDWNRRLDSLTPDDQTFFFGGAAREFQQLSHDGHIIIRGRPSKKGGPPHTDIPREVWLEQQIDMESALGGNTKTEYLPNSAQQFPLYYQLVVSQAEVENLLRDKLTDEDSA